ncbi:urate oxidase [Actinomadura madurae]|uniref:factor-independent urate hydroxylase n=1 Tax=Actinomadura madurae TaxID=1993 RepID=UPI00399BCA89
MAIRLGPNQYGKAETRVVRVYRGTASHGIRDLSVSTSLRGRFEAAHLSGDQRDVLPTDTQKNTVFAFAKKEGIGAIEDYALSLGRRFLRAAPAADAARVAVEEYGWERIEVHGVPHDHAFVRSGAGVRTTTAYVEGSQGAERACVVSGVKDLVLLKSTGSEFSGFLKDEYTTLQETHDRILATSLVACWRYSTTDLDWDASFAAIRALLMSRFAEIHSLALQQTLYGVGESVLAAHPEVNAIRLSAPNKHHFLVDLRPFGMENDGEVFIAADRPYGLIETTVLRDEAPEPFGGLW